MPCGHNDLKAVRKLKHNYDLKSVSPITSHTLFRPWGRKPTGQRATNANQHFKEPNSMASQGDPSVSEDLAKPFERDN